MSWSQKKEERTSNRLNVDRLMRVMSEIFSEMYGVEVTMTAVPKEREMSEGVGEIA